MKIKFGKGSKLKFGGNGRHIFAFHKSFRRIVRQFKAQVKRQDPKKLTGRLLGGTSTRQRPLPVPTTRGEAQVAGAVAFGAVTGGPVGAATAAITAGTKLEAERRTAEAAERGQGREAVIEAERVKKLEAEKKKKAAAVKATVLAATAETLTTKRRRAGRAALISTSPQGILGEPLTGRRRLAAR